MLRGPYRGETGEPRGGGTRSIHDRESDGASYCEPKKIHEPEILCPQK